MKKVIDGALYNTESAKLLGTWDNGLGARDFNRCAESLYRNNRGKYFLYGEGGANTRYSTKINDSSWGGGEAIIPLSYDGAKVWAENNLTADEYIAAFGDPDQDGEKVVRTAYLSPAANRRLEQLQAERGASSFSAVIEDLLLAAK